MCSQSDQVCGDAGFCVDCLVDDDCLGANKCLANKCVAQTECQSSKQCDGQVCDKDAGVCVGCLSADDCAAGKLCSAASSSRATTKTPVPGTSVSPTKAASTPKSQGFARWQRVHDRRYLYGG